MPALKYDRGNNLTSLQNICDDLRHHKRAERDNAAQYLCRHMKNNKTGSGDDTSSK